jgi:hypothetical protein
MELERDRLARGKARYSLHNSAEWKEDEHPRADDGKFGSGGSSNEGKSNGNTIILGGKDKKINVPIKSGMPTEQEIGDQIKKLMESNDYDIRHSWVGLRGLNIDKENEIDEDGNLAHSWNNPEGIEPYELDGTSAVGITQDADQIDGEEEKINRSIKDAMKKVSQYSKGKIALVVGDSGEMGNDDFNNEYVINQAKAIMIWDTKKDNSIRVYRAAK